MEEKIVEKSEQNPEPTDPYNWLLGFEFITALVILSASAAGYLVLK